MITLLAIDIGHKAGWALFVNGEYVDSAPLVLPIPKHASYRAPYLFGLYFSGLLQAVLDTYGETIVYYDRGFVGGQNTATESQARLRGVLLYICGKYKVTAKGIRPKAAKKTSTGDGAATKDDMITQANVIAGRSMLSDDEADAVLIGVAGLAALNTPAIKIAPTDDMLRHWLTQDTIMYIHRDMTFHKQKDGSKLNKKNVFIRPEKIDKMPEYDSPVYKRKMKKLTTAIRKQQWKWEKRTSVR